MNFISVISTEMKFQTDMRFSCEHNLPPKKLISTDSFNIVPSANDDNTDETNDRGENNCFRCSFFTYRGLNQHLRTCLKKKRDVIVTDSQPARSRAVNDLQSTTESQQHQKVREIVSEEYTNIKWEVRNLCEYLKRCKMRMNVLSSERKTYSCFQQVQLQNNT